MLKLLVWLLLLRHLGANRAIALLHCILAMLAAPARIAAAAIAAALQIYVRQRHGGSCVRWGQWPVTNQGLSHDVQLYMCSPATRMQPTCMMGVTIKSDSVDFYNILRRFIILIQIIL